MMLKSLLSGGRGGEARKNRRKKKAKTRERAPFSASKSNPDSTPMGEGRGEIVKGRKGLLGPRKREEAHSYSEEIPLLSTGGIDEKA